MVKAHFDERNSSSFFSSGICATLMGNDFMPLNYEKEKFSLFLALKLCMYVSVSY
jgi:hypothetical protein